MLTSAVRGSGLDRHAPRFGRRHSSATLRVSSTYTRPSSEETYPRIEFTRFQDMRPMATCVKKHALSRCKELTGSCTATKQPMRHAFRALKTVLLSRGLHSQHARRPSRRVETHLSMRMRFTTLPDGLDGTCCGVLVRLHLCKLSKRDRGSY